MTFTCDDVDAFENFFHDFCMVKKDTEILWGPDYWKLHGVNVVNSRVEYNTPEHRTMFLLRWA